MTTICICGAGTMGSGIAQVVASAGFSTILYDLDKNILRSAQKKMEKDLQALVDKEKIKEEEMKSLLGRIFFTDDADSCYADLVIEAVVENAAIKAALFNQLAAINT